MLRSQLRADLRAKRRALSQDFQQIASKQLVDLLFTSIPQINDQNTFALYLANDGELDPKELILKLWDLNKQVYLPIVDPNHKEMSFRLYTKDTKLIANKYNILEPSAHAPLIALDQLEVIFTPLVAFDQKGNRLGMGGGYYDTTLKKCNQDALIIGLAHDLQCVDQIPCESWDVPLKCIATPTHFYKF